MSRSMHSTPQKRKSSSLRGVPLTKPFQKSTNDLPMNKMKRRRLGLDGSPSSRRARSVTPSRLVPKQQGRPNLVSRGSGISVRKRDKKNQRSSLRERPPNHMMVSRNYSLTPRRGVSSVKSKKSRWSRKRRAVTGKPEYERWDPPPPVERLKVPPPQKDGKTAPSHKEAPWVLEAWTTGVASRETARKRLVNTLTKLGTQLKVNYVRIAIEVETALFEGLSGKDYTNQLRDVTFNLGSKKNDEFRTRVLLEKIDPKNVVTMKAHEMASSALQKKREQNMKKAAAERNSDHIKNKTFKGESEFKAILGEDAAQEKM